MKRTPLVRRTPLRSRRPHREWNRPPEDRVTPEVVAIVLKRDGPCLAVKLGEPASACWGRTTFEHVHEDYGKKGVRALSDPAHLVALCCGHTEPGMKAGFQWNTTHTNREKVRKWLVDHA
jgi:hypothetical protein